MPGPESSSAEPGTVWEMNKKGHKATLVPSHPGNTNAVKSGVHSPRIVVFQTPPES